MQYQTVSALLTATAEYTIVTPSVPLQNPTQKPASVTQTAVPTFPGQVEEPVLVVSVTQVAGKAAEKPSSNAAGVECDLAHPGRPIDITIPDETRVHPGEYFTKTWRLVNGGSCAWDQSYSVVWFSGDDLGVNRNQRFNNEIVPGTPVDVTVDMIAPKAPGTYQSNWKLRNSEGELFGIGPNGDAPFWVRIVVIPLETATVTPTLALPTATSTPAISAEGKILMKLEDWIDLDSGLLNQPDEDDLRFMIGSEEVLVLMPVGDALLAPFGAGKPGFNECLLAPLNTEPARMDHYQPGTYFCYRTTQGLPGWFLLTSLDLNAKEASLEFLTWSMP